MAGMLYPLLNNMEEDQVLVNECRKNNCAAFEILYKKYAAKMKGIAYQYIGDSSEAEDIIQEVFIKVFRKINSFDSTGPFEAWLRRIVVNTAINFYHAKKKEKEELRELVHIRNDDAEQEWADQEEGEELSYSRKQILDAMSLLPAGYKMVFNLYVLENYTHTQIAEVLKISAGASKSQLFKAKKYLRNLLSRKLAVA
jgi:RNA polymerase sigma-70 factor (ECF subfamily)